MPDDDRLCHGDFHPFNILMPPHGPVIIDWTNAAIGNPLADVAMTVVILTGVKVSKPSHSTLSHPGIGEQIDTFTQAYLKRYFELRPGDRQQLSAWRPIMAAVRMNDHIPGLEEWLVDQVKIGLSQLK